MDHSCKAGSPFDAFQIRAHLLSLLFLIITALTVANLALAEESRPDTIPVEFNIPAQFVPAALGELARQARVQLFFISDGFETVQANAVVGSYSTQQALNLLLAGTGLTASFVQDSGVKVRPVQKTLDALALGPLYFAAREDNSRDPEAGHERISAAPDEHRAPNSVSDEIIVTGSHIRGIDNVGGTTMTFTREDLTETGFSTVEELFESLPQNLDELSPDATFAEGTSRIASANTQGASGISLRGLGPGSTLVLLNGRRRPGNINGRVFDVSAIPLSMIERIEILTGGHSAIYGSDAVAGVVNIVTRAGFNGAETQIYYGESSAGGGRFNFSQTFGRDLAEGGFVVGYNYRKDKGLDVTNTGVVRGPSFLGFMPLPGLFLLQDPSEQHVAMFAGHLEVSDSVKLYADAHLSSDRNEGGVAFSRLGVLDVASIGITESDQYSAVGGVRLDAGRSWQVDLSGLYGVVDNTTGFASVVLPGGSITSLHFPTEFEDDDEAQLISLSAIADGPLGEVFGSAVSAAVGINARNESYESIRTDLPTAMVTPGENRDRDIWSIFSELHLPLMIGTEAVQMSFAGRYEHYSDFGNTFNPQAGIEWEPIDGLSLHGSYSQAFRAPDLVTLAQSTQVSVRTVNDPLDSSGMTTATTFTEFGGNPNLKPEEADTWTIGLDWEPSDRTTLSLSYFRIKYEGRIDQAALTDSTALQDEELYPGLVNRAPTPEELQIVLDRLTDSSRLINQTGIPFELEIDDPFAVFTNIVLFDNRRHNIAVEEIDGVDIKASTVMETNTGNWSFDMNGSYYFDFTRNITSTAPSIDQLNQPGKLVDLRLRGGVGWSGSAWAVNAFVNYVDSYVDTNAPTPTIIDSWTTVDLIFRFDVSEATDIRALNEVTVTFGISNLLDEDPPTYLSSRLGLGYDSANADPIGRFTSLRIVKGW